jgi:hypothetical protein
MGLLDLFSGSSGRKASQATALQLAQLQNQIGAQLQTGQNQAIGTIDAAQPQALSALNTGYDQARSDYGAAQNYFNPYAQTGLAGFNMYANANGLNGPTGNAAATSAFQASPGYQWMVDQSLDNIARKQGTLGMTTSGNTLAALSDRAGNMANQEYLGWLGRLQGIGQTGFNAATGQAGIGRGMGDLATRRGETIADVYSGDATRKAGIYGNTSALMANSLLNLGTKQAENTGAGLMAGQNASANTLSALLGVLGLGSRAAGAYYGRVA